MNESIGTHRSEKAFDRLADATRTGKVGYFAVTYDRIFDGHGQICFMATGFEDAKKTFDGFGLGNLVSLREISWTAFQEWYKVLVRRVAEEGGL